MVLVPLLVVCWLFGATAGVHISVCGFNRTSIFQSKKSKKIVVTTVISWRLIPVCSTMVFYTVDSLT